MQRIFLLDTMRFVALVSMVIFHIHYDLVFFYHWLSTDSPLFWRVLQVVFAGGLFIFVSGWTATLGRRSFLGLLAIGLCALLVSLATYFFVGGQYVRFGILHFMFTANLLYLLVLQHCSSKFLVLIAASLLLLSSYFQQIYIEHELLIWLDILPIGYQSVDHYPLPLWLPVFIAGIIWGRAGMSEMAAESFQRYAQHGELITKCSRNSLRIYILHQPLILLMLEGIRLIIGK